MRKKGWGAILEIEERRYICRWAPPAWRPGEGGPNAMEMNLYPGWNEAIINLMGPCKLDITKDDTVVATTEVPSGESYRLILKRSDKKPKDFLAGMTGKIPK
ncbi:MAG: hypothetical protein A2060_04335 [Planctomycetes bacterium GWA2_50_13]|nr:MAG: hypothetical protein A2060_04335 [Planctomycetes bacterium GWA2_50_13]OHC04521.1 MAG: hypothetical protein A3G17_01300 [Planctomycetes bacterium RIFCSPLOWO2_12_FULL_50_35]